MLAETGGQALWLAWRSPYRADRQVMEMVVAGETNKGGARHLDISEKTVKIHRAKVMEKMQATSLAHLVKMVAILENY